MIPMKTLTLIICLTLVSGFAFSQWVQQNQLSTSNDLNSIIFTNSNTGYAVGEYGAIIKTTDGGITWSTLSSGTPSDLISVFFPDVNTGYAVGENGAVIKTTDGGITWTTLSSGTNASLNSVFFTDNNTGYAVGDIEHFRAIILKTTDGGGTWASDTILTRTLLSVYFIDKNTGYSVGWDISKTVDGGATWNTIIVTENIVLNSVFFPDYNVGYAVGGWRGQGTIIKTIDAGETWVTLLSGISAPLYSVFFTDINTGYAVGGNRNSLLRGGLLIGDCGSKQIILKTIDGGNKWTKLKCVTNEQLNSIFLTDANTGYAVGENGTILKTTNGGGFPTVVENGSLELTISIYPNPATNKVSIETKSNLQEETIVCIFNMNGAILQQDKFQSQNLVEMDVSTLAKGIYLLKIQTKAGVETKKLVVQ
jgi:photosystem II stability/assembly factor-like uncharacterized protein